MSYNREDLIAATTIFLTDVYYPFKVDRLIDWVDIRLQLVDGTYYLHSGDSSFDDDNRGAWGYGEINTKCSYKNDEDMTQQFKLVATEIVDNSLENI